MGVQVPAEIPVGRAVRYAVHSDGVTCTANAAVSSVPRPARPVTAHTTASPAAQAAGRGLALPRSASMIVSVPASSVTEHDGMSAAQYRDSAK